MQLTDVAPRRNDPRPTDSQRVAQRRRAEAARLGRAGSRAPQAARSARSRARAAEVRAGRAADDRRRRALGRRDVRVSRRRAIARRRAPRRCRATSASRRTPKRFRRRNKVGDAQDRRRLAILNLKTGEGVWAGLDGVSDPIAIPKPLGRRRPRAAAPARTAGTAGAEARRALGHAAAVARRPTRGGVGALRRQHRALAGRRRSRDRHDASARSPSHDEAWVREIGPSNNVSGGLGWLPDNRRVWFLAEHDGWMHLYTVDATAPTRRAQAADDRPVRDRHRGAVAGRHDVLHPVDRAASRRAAPLCDERRRRRAHEARPR